MGNEPFKGAQCPSDIVHDSECFGKNAESDGSEGLRRFSVDLRIDLLPCFQVRDSDNLLHDEALVWV